MRSALSRGAVASAFFKGNSSRQSVALHPLMRFLRSTFKAPIVIFRFLGLTQHRMTAPPEDQPVTQARRFSIDADADDVIIACSSTSAKCSFVSERRHEMIADETMVVVSCLDRA
jgi:hypothetical protein